MPVALKPSSPASPVPYQKDAAFVAAPSGGSAPVYDQAEPEQEQASFDQAQVPSPEPLAAAAAPMNTAQVIVDLWRKWKEWGSPFATGPGQAARVSGGDNDPLRFRIMARLDVPIVLDDRPGMRWLFVKALKVPFLDDLVFQANPHMLRQGATYEMRFLARSKSTPTRDAVKAGLVEMGFAPIKLSAIKRNMKLPGRPASLTLWYGMAEWNRANSVIINDDPFFFENVQEIRGLS